MTPAASSSSRPVIYPPIASALLAVSGWARRVVTALAAGALIAGASTVLAAPGDLDPSFSGDGKATTAFFTDANASASVNAIAFQPDGRIVAAGSASRSQESGAGTSEFALARYNADGTLDTSFSGDGKVTKDIAGGQDYAYGVAVQADGKIVAVGSANLNAASFYTRFTLVRFNADGSLDTGFGTSGVVSTDFFGTQNAATSVALQADGRIVVAGSAHDGVANRFALARYNADGSLDASFGTGGKVTTSFFGFDDGATAVKLQADGKIVVVGSAYPGGANNQFAVARYNADGSLDAGFGTGGKVTTDFFGANDLGHALVLQAEGKIVAGGIARIKGASADEFALARYNADGSLDTSFGGDGKATAAFSQAYVRRLAAAGQADGKIVTASWGVDGATGFDVFALARFNEDGGLDSSFGTNGIVTTSFLGSQNQAYAVGVQHDGAIVAAGTAFDTQAFYSLFALARYDGGSGTAPALALSGLAVSPASVIGGASATGTVTLNTPAPSGGVVVTLADDSPATTMAASVTVPQGATSASFGVTTTAVIASTVATLTATCNGVSRTPALTVAAPPPAPSLASLTLSPASVTGGSASSGTVTLTGAAPAGGAVVTLGDNSSAASVPGSVTVAAGATAASFTVTTSPVFAATTATISGSYGGETRSAALALQPAATARLTVTATGRSGHSVTSTPAGINVRVGRSGSANFAVGTAITLRVSNSREAIWSGACSSGGNRARTCSFTLNANASVTANVR